MLWLQDSPRRLLLYESFGRSFASPPPVARATWVLIAVFLLLFVPFALSWEFADIHLKAVIRDTDVWYVRIWVWEWDTFSHALIRPMLICFYSCMMSKTVPLFARCKFSNRGRAVLHHTFQDWPGAFKAVWETLFYVLDLMANKRFSERMKPAGNSVLI